MPTRKPAQRKAERAQHSESALEFVYKLEGQLRDMSVFELAPALHSMGVMLRTANRALFPQARD